MITWLLIPILLFLFYKAYLQEDEKEEDMKISKEPIGRQERFWYGLFRFGELLVMLLGAIFSVLTGILFTIAEFLNPKK